MDAWVNANVKRANSIFKVPSGAGACLTLKLGQATPLLKLLDYPHSVPVLFLSMAGQSVRGLRSKKNPPRPAVGSRWVDELVRAYGSIQQVKAIQVGDLGPSSDEVGDELLLAIGAGVHL